MINEFFTVQSAYAHSGEEEEPEIVAMDYAGPGLALLIIVVTAMIVRRISKK